MTTSPIDLDKLKALMAKATPEKWYVEDSHLLYDEDGNFIASFHGSKFAENTVCVAASHNIMPRLIAELEAARKALGEKHD